MWLDSQKKCARDRRRAKRREMLFRLFFSKHNKEKILSKKKLNAFHFYVALSDNRRTFRLDKLTSFILDWWESLFYCCCCFGQSRLYGPQYNNFGQEDCRISDNGASKKCNALQLYLYFKAIKVGQFASPFCFFIPRERERKRKKRKRQLFILA